MGFFSMFLDTPRIWKRTFPDCTLETSPYWQNLLERLSRVLLFRISRDDATHQKVLANEAVVRTCVYIYISRMCREVTPIFDNNHKILPECGTAQHCCSIECDIPKLKVQPEFIGFVVRPTSSLSLNISVLLAATTAIVHISASVLGV